MNAIPPVSTAPHSSAPAPADAAQSSSQTAGASGDFARALNDVGGKPARKHAAGRQHGDSGGGALPTPGNQPPPAAVALPVTQAPPAAQPTDGSAAAAAAPAPMRGPNPGPGEPASGAAQVGTVATDPAGQALADMATLAGAAPSNAARGAADSAFALVDPAVTANDHPATPVPAARPPGPPPGAAAAAAVPARPAGALAGAGADAPSAQTAPNKTQPAAATLDSTPTDASAPLNDAAPADATAAAAMAAQSLAASAVARDPSPSPASAAVTDDRAAPDTGASSPDVSAANAAAATASAAHAAAAASAAGSAASAASFEQSLLASAAAAMGKRHDNGTGNAASGVSNDTSASAGAAQLLTSNSSTDAAVPVPTLKVTAGVDTPEFGQGLADRVSLMMDSNLTSAKLQVNPPALGPIEVRIALQNGHAQVWLSSHSAVTRDALESSAPKLREMLGSQGFGQVSVDISQRSFQERQPQPQPYPALPALGELPGITRASVSMAHIPSGLLDAYA